MSRRHRLLFTSCVGWAVVLLVGAAAWAAPLPDRPVQGYGFQRPLDEVFHKIVPESVTIIIDPAIDRSVRLNWHGGPSWQAALSDALSGTGLRAEYSDRGVYVTRSPLPPIETHPNITSAPIPAPPTESYPRPTGTPMRLAQPGATDSGSPPPAAPESIAAPSPANDMASTQVVAARAVIEEPLPPPPPPLPLWKTNAGEDFVVAMGRWAKAAGWGMADPVTAKDSWTVKVEMEYRGTFEDAVKYISSGFSSQSLQPGPVFYPNQILDFVSLPTGASSADPRLGRVQ